jgi:hypothetical protein
MAVTVSCLRSITYGGSLSLRRGGGAPGIAFVCLTAEEVAGIDAAADELNRETADVLNIRRVGEAAWSSSLGSRCGKAER